MTVQLIMAIHNHQPVGNFDSVFAQACERCYRPLLQALEHHPGVELAMHFSGPLLEWLEDNQPDLIDQLGRLHERNRVEMLGGGFYEPMLSVLPRDDALGQLEMMRQYLERRFGAKARGIWLTERVWEPELASLLAEAGVDYTLVDDTHFFYAGMEPRRLTGYYVTEKAGQTLAIFPIDKGLRYAIPFRPAGELVAELERADDGREETCGLVYGDDGEKFGIWPGTHEWVFGQGWLDDFLTRLEQSRVETVPPGRFLDRQRTSGLIYLPTASYEEMLTWALPAEAIARLQQLQAELERQGLLEQARPFLRGGLWQNFMVKYPEANHLHKKMLHASGKLAEALAADELDPESPQLQQARRLLYRGQCNCAYWHGLFGGLYLPHLRDAIYRNLIAAEDEIDRLQQGEEDWISFEEEDFDGDRADEILVENRWLNVYVDPSRGGCLTEIDHRPTRFCLSNTLTRRIEGYHREILEASGEQHQPAGDQDEAPPASIHDRVRLIDPGLGERLVADNCWRRSFLDRFPAPDTTLEQLYQGTYREEGDFLDAPYHLEQASIDEDGDCDFIMLMTRAGCIERDGRRWQLLLEKRLVVAADRADLRVEYRLRNTSNEPLSLCFAPELNLTLLAGDSPDRLYEFAGLIGPGPRMRSMGELDQATWFALVDHSQHLRVRLEFDPPATVWRHPVETVSQSETGFELLYQGSAILPCWRLQLVANQTHVVSVRLQLQTISADSVVPLEPPAAG
ncbi:MAG: alpha-amylase [Deltaproteobacteria bacterium]|nr:MAG: alpha-amylase [Deltaproteobacteria bacterium]